MEDDQGNWETFPTLPLGIFLVATIVIILKNISCALGLDWFDTRHCYSYNILNSI